MPLFQPLKYLCERCSGIVNIPKLNSDLIFHSAGATSCEIVAAKAIVRAFDANCNASKVAADEYDWRSCMRRIISEANFDTRAT